MYSLEKIIANLNEMARADPKAIGNLIKARVACNQELADHPTCQVGATTIGYEVGLLGILNGIVGTREDQQGLIAAVFEDDGRIYFQEHKQ